MPEVKAIKVALVGNPNTGKTSLFNTLTGLNQKVGNYPGITVDKKVGKAELSELVNASIVDLPGTYSINPTSIDVDHKGRVWVCEAVNYRRKKDEKLSRTAVRRVLLPS